MDVVSISFIAMFAFITIPAIVIIIKRLLMKSTSRDLKIKILRRHILYFVFYLFFVGQTILQFSENPLYIKVKQRKIGLWTFIKVHMADAFM